MDFLEKDLIDNDDDDLFEALHDSKKFKKLKKVAALVFVFVLLIGGIVLQSTRINNLKGTIAELEKRLTDPHIVEPVSPEIVLDIIQAEVNNIGELISVEYLYTNAAKFENPKQVFGFNVPFTTKTFVTKWDGIIKAGIDTERIKTTLDDERSIITIYLPDAGISSHELLQDSVEVFSEKDGMFNPVTVEDFVKFENANKEYMEKRAIENGLLKQATENAKIILTKLLNANPTVSTEYKLVFKSLKDY